MEIPEQLRPAVAFLRGNLSGLLRFDTEYMPIRVVIAPDGRLVASVMESMLRSTDCALHLPEEPDDRDDEVIQLMVTLDRFEESGPDGTLADRWRIYHGDPPDVRWATMSIDFCKFRDLAIDGEAMMTANPIAEEEPAICRGFNESDGDDLRRLVLQRVEVELEDPKIVGVDSLGFDVRGRFEIARIDFEDFVDSSDAARAAIESLLKGSA
ncbi:MAG: hypothetical protein GY885_04150 [Phycisphaeraceae bacterium]|nr:hypothetical protein [Phycisphaeraceae bacterium]